MTVSLTHAVNNIAPYLGISTTLSRTVVPQQYSWVAPVGRPPPRTCWQFYAEHESGSGNRKTMELLPSLSSDCRNTHRPWWRSRFGTVSPSVSPRILCYLDGNHLESVRLPKLSHRCNTTRPVLSGELYRWSYMRTTFCWISTAPVSAYVWRPLNCIYPGLWYCGLP